MIKKTSLFLLLPTVAMILSGCNLFGSKDQGQDNSQQTGGGDSGEGEGSGEGGGGQTDTGETQRQLFSQIVSNLKSTHNYTLSISSSLEEDTEEEAIEYHRYNLNDRAWYHDNSTFDAEGIIYQKNQGYVTFVKSGSNVIPMNINTEFDYETDKRVFVSANPQLKISDLVQVTGENLFIDEYTQDATDKSKFVSTSLDNRTVAAYLTQYSAYIGLSFQVDEKITAVLDSSRSEITLTMDYWLYYFDIVEHNDKGTITITVGNVGTTTDNVISSYIENPTTTFSAPQSWPDGMDEVFEEYYGGVVPVLPSGLSYGAVCDELLYDGFYYASVQDVNSGNLTTSYGAQLIEDGYTKVSDTKYVKSILDDQTTITKSYVVTMLYKEASNLYPNGVMTILYRCNSTTGSFESIEAFNAYMERMGHSSYIPALPEESTCTGIKNFKDVTSQHSGYAFYSGTDWMHVCIPTYAKAAAWIESFVSALAEMGFDDKSSLFWDSYNFNQSNSGTCIALSKITEQNYNGQIDVRYQIAEADVPLIETYGAEAVSIAVTNPKTSFETGSGFSFGGTCVVTFDNEATREIMASELTFTGYNMNSEGTQTVTVHYGELTTTYQIEVKTTREVVKIELGGMPSLQFKKNSTFSYSGLSVKATYSNGDTDFVGSNCEYTVDMTTTGVKTVTVSYTYHETTVTASYEILVSEAISFPEITFDITTLDGWCTQLDEETDADVFNYNNFRSFYFYFVPKNQSAVVNGVSVKNDATAIVELIDGDLYGMGIQQYKITPTINFSASSVELVVDLDEPQVTMYTVSKATVTNGLISYARSQYAEGETVSFSVTPNSGYQIDSVTATGVTVSGSNGTYSFVMPANDVEISATFNLIPTAHSISTSVTGSGSINSVTVNGVAGTSAMAGDTVQIDAKASDTDVYRVKSAVITTEGGQTIEWIKKAGKYQFTMPEDNVTFTVVFEEIPSYTITKSTTKCNISYNSGVTSNSSKVGTTVVFKVIPVDGYELVNGSVTVTMTEGGESVTCTPDFVPGNYRFTMPEGGVTISATCELIPVTLSSIAVSGAPTSFDKNGTFSSAGLVVTATMSDNSTKTVTPTSIDYSAVDMTTAGSYPIVVSYTEDDVTKTATYVVTVSDGQTPVTSSVEQLLSELGKIKLSCQTVGMSDCYCDFTFDALGTGTEYAFKNNNYKTSYTFSYSCAEETENVYNLSFTNVASKKEGILNYGNAGVDKVGANGAYMKVYLASDGSSIESIHLQIDDSYNFIWNAN